MKRLTNDLKRNAAKLLLSAIGTCCFVSIGNTQDNDDGLDDEVIEVIYVTASRREERLIDVPASMASVDMEGFARSGLTDPKSVLESVPGVQLENFGSTYQNIVSMRGIVASGSAGVSTYVDEIPYGSSTAYNIGGVTVNATLLEVDRIEVIKGPQGTLYGASAMGGLVKYVTRQPSLTDASGDLSADMSWTSKGGLNQLYRGTFTAPLSEHKVAVGFSGFYQDAEGFIDNPVLGVEGVDDYEYYGGSGNLLWDATEKLTISLQGMYQKSEQDGLTTIQVDSTTGVPVVGRYSTGNASLAPSKYEAELFAMTINYDFEWAELTSATSTQDTSFEQTLDITDGIGFLADLFDPANAPHTVQFPLSVGFDRITQELRLISPSGEKVEWLAGIYYSEEEGFLNQEFATDPPFDLLKISLPSSYDEFAVFGNFTYYFTPEFDATVGIRQSNNEASFEQIASGLLVVPVPKNVSDDDVTTYLFTARYRPSEQVSWYGRIASGYRPGGANAVGFDPITGDPLAPPVFLADELWNYELGVKGNTANNNFAYELSVFFIDWKDYQIGIVRNGIGVLGNADSAESVGVEAGMRLAVTDNFDIEATIAYVNAELSVDEPDLGGAIGSRIPGSPEVSGSVSANYRFDIAGNDVYVNANFRHRGDFPTSFDGVTIDGTFFPPSLPNFNVDSYNVVDLSAGLDIGRFDVSVYATNLLDEYTYENVATNPLAPGAANVLRPRTVGLRVKANFD